MLSVSSEGMVKLWVDVTTQFNGGAAVELIEQLPVWAAAIWALKATAQAAAPAMANFRMVFNSGEWLTASLTCGLATVAPALHAASRPGFRVVA
jgi:hypothetical protein